MKTSSTAAAGVLALAALVSAQSRCAIECFQKVITEHPPLTCTEENMYLCFCKAQDLQNYFVDCAYDSCSSEVDAVVQFGVGLCSELGAPITVVPRVSTTAVAAVSSTAAAAVTTSEPAAVVTSTPAAVETLITTTSPVAQPSESEAAEESSPSASEDSYPVPSAAVSSAAVSSVSSAAVVPSASGNGTAAPTTTPVPAGAAFNGASGLVAAGVAVFAALF
ncbi:hypothetical protein F5X68DRAFT_33489 [Plectosphaerella plurivora]|uniref:CFEM domain-containing protein n=1 Tax=Plectosphaerella plurivora TaxID=936078 RepID=A0A9P8V6Q5_9PEZI|nr:hypothetical protein F5X68DRAFT_33489 [Plectosphaerella plurivora]